MNRIAFLAIPLALSLTACEDSAEPDAGNGEQGGKAEGEVLGGTISDDMIPLEEIRSQSPPASRSEGGGTDDGD